MKVTIGSITTLALVAMIVGCVAPESPTKSPQPQLSQPSAFRTQQLGTQERQIEKHRITGEVLSCVAIDYDRNTGKGSPLSTLGTVKLNEKGFIEGVKGKSGWVMINTWGNYTDDTTGMTKKVKLIGVSFWVNKGGTNWWDFEVQMVNPEDDPKENLPFETKIEDIKPGENRPVIILQGKYKLVPVGSLNSVSFQEEK